jgi:hypothetical protein
MIAEQNDCKDGGFWVAQRFSAAMNGRRKQRL